MTKIILLHITEQQQGAEEATWAYKTT